VGAGLAFPVPDAGACTLWVSERGTDVNPGSVDAPFRSVQKLVNSLSPGQVGCLTPGSVFAEPVRIGRPGIELRTAPGRRATIRGGVRVLPGADNVVISSLVIQGADVGQLGTVLVEANGVRLLGNDISGRFLPNRNVSCILLERAFGTVIDRNTIHHCTRATTRRLYSAGIVVANASATTILNNFISHTVGDAIALAPNARGSLVHNNLIDGNVGGVYFGGSAQTASSDNRVVNNIISFSGRYNVHASYLPGAPVGQNNVVSGNCLWRGAVANVAGAGVGFHSARNRIASPRYVDRLTSYRLHPGPCYLNRPRGHASRRYAVLPRFLVRYRLLGLPRAVRVVDLGMVNVLPGATIDVRCVRGCRVSERLLAGRRGTASSVMLRGRWLRRGAVIEVRARKRWWVGHVARIIVTGLPRGVRIHHACLPPFGVPRPVPCLRYR
jgi:hypothetical protein